MNTFMNFIIERVNSVIDGIFYNFGSPAFNAGVQFALLVIMIFIIGDLLITIGKKIGKKSSEKKEKKYNRSLNDDINDNYLKAIKRFNEINNN